MKRVVSASVSVSEDILKMMLGFFNYVGEKRAVVPPLALTINFKD